MRGEMFRTAACLGRPKQGEPGLYPIPVSLELGEEVVLARLAAEFELAVTVDDQTKLSATVCTPILFLRHYALPQQFSGGRRAR
jgi:hypothetical protein